jgi:ATP-binding cassette, subfamily C (CFTR/MRP), member 1
VDATLLSNTTFALKDGTEVLRDITISLPQASLSTVIGKVGSGKSSLLKGILGELAIKTGTVSLRTTSIGYCSQTPWLRNITVKEKIIGKARFDQAWFSTVIHACCLDQDIAMFPRTEDTIVGSGGIALSGGQKQRVVRTSIFRTRSFHTIDTFRRHWLGRSTPERSCFFSTMSSSAWIIQVLKPSFRNS